MSTSEGQVIENGDIVEIKSDILGLPFVNPVFLVKKTENIRSNPYGETSFKKFK